MNQINLICLQTSIVKRSGISRRRISQKSGMDQRWQLGRLERPRSDVLGGRRNHGESDGKRIESERQEHRGQRKK